MKIVVRYKQAVKKAGNTQTYNTDELEALNKYLDIKYEETNDSVYIAVRLNFFLGLRIGDVIVLNREGEAESYYVEKDGFTVIVDFTKKDNSASGPAVTIDTAGFHIEGKEAAWVVVDEKGKPSLENWQKYMENGEYLRSSEIEGEQNYKMIDGRRRLREIWSADGNKFYKNGNPVRISRNTPIWYKRFTENVGK